ncbi:MAG TPA: isochorismatase family protein [Acidimicrobiales bacterium]|nr:isochorismatase family protein [Acidimicrobiales bacterium]
MQDYDELTALVVVDVQNDFADPGGGLPVPGGDEVVAVVNGEVQRAGRSGSLVVYTQDWHPPVTPHFRTEGGLWPVHCVQGTWGAELHPDLDVVGQVIQKGTEGEDGYSGFSVRDPTSGDERDTALESVLRRASVERVVVVGLAADVCVKDTALDAARRGFRTTVLRDATRPVELQSGDSVRAEEELRSAGVEVT